MLISNLNLFLRIVEMGGLAAAGREVGLSPASVSERLATLEAHYGVRLLNRTTRSISLTEEGRELAKGAKRILAETNDLESRIKLGVEKISGPIHISAPVDLGRNVISPILDDFMKEHPEINIDLTILDGYVDLVDQGIDLAIRFGDLADSSLKSRKLGDNKRIVCASPDYLEKNGTPKHPDDLRNHNCILMRFGNEVDRTWRFKVDGKETACPVRGNRIVNDGELVRTWCLAGHGIAFKSNWDVQKDIDMGQLVPILEDFAPPATSLQIVYPSGAPQTRRLRLLIDQVLLRFSSKNY